MNSRTRFTKAELIKENEQLTNEVLRLHQVLRAKNRALYLPKLEEILEETDPENREDYFESLAKALTTEDNYFARLAELVKKDVDGDKS